MANQIKLLQIELPSDPKPELPPPPKPKKKKKKILSFDDYLRGKKDLPNVQLPLLEPIPEPESFLSEEEAHKLMDRIKNLTLDESIELQRWWENLPRLEQEKQVDLFLARHEHTDRIFILGGHMLMSIYRDYNFPQYEEVAAKIIAARPNGKNNYCWSCDSVHIGATPQCPIEKNSNPKPGHTIEDTNNG